jgi:hypothetical protein
MIDALFTCQSRTAGPRNKLTSSQLCPTANDASVINEKSEGLMLTSSDFSEKTEYKEKSCYLFKYREGSSLRGNVKKE